MPDYFLKGFVGAIPEAKTVKGGIKVVEFILAVTGGLVDKPKKIWVKCVAWRELGELVQENVFQGDLVGINGRVADVETWIDSKGKPSGRLVMMVSDVAKGKRAGELISIRSHSRHERLPDDAVMYFEIP